MYPLWTSKSLTITIAQCVVFGLGQPLFQGLYMYRLTECLKDRYCCPYFTDEEIETQGV